MSSINKEFFRQALIARRRKMTPAGRARSRNARGKRWQYPWALEKAYATTLEKWITPLVTAVEGYLAKYAESILHGDSVRLDALPGPGFVSMVRTLQGWVGAYFPDPSTNRSPSGIMMGLGNTAAGIKSFAEKQWGKITEPILGFQFNPADPWWEPLRDKWADANFKLIKTISSRYIDAVNDYVEQAITNGWSYQTLMADIHSMGLKLKGWQVRRLARDQVGKLNGQISQALQEDAGVEWYTWETAGDERVRGNPAGRFPKAVPSHYLMDGVLCRWDDASVYSVDKGKTWIPRLPKMPKVHPGQEIQCRCVALPYMETLLQEADSIISKEKASPLTLALENIESSFAGLDHEEGYILDSHGNVILHKIGDMGSVSFSEEDAVKMKNQIMTHNHPNPTSNTPLSIPDIRMFYVGELKEIRAVGPSMTYSLKRGKAIVNAESWDSFKRAFDDHFSKILDEDFSKALPWEGFSVYNNQHVMRLALKRTAADFKLVYKEIVREGVKKSIPKAVITPKINPEWLKKNLAWDASARLDMARSMSLSLEDYLKRCDELVKDIVKDTDMCIRCPSDVFSKILKDGRFKSQFETKTSGGCLNNNLRAEMEFNVFGYDLKDVKDRPIYGYLLKGDPVKVAPRTRRYGSVVVKLKEDLRERATVTFGDSLDRTAGGIRPRLAPTPLADPKWNSLSYSTYNPATEIATYEDAISHVGYLEVQYHGGVSVDDIREVVFTENAPTKEVVEMLEKKRIKWRWWDGAKYVSSLL